MSYFDVLGVNETLAQFAAVGVAGKAAAEVGTAALAEEVAEIARTSHPWDSESGETLASIHVEERDGKAAAVAGGAAIFLEFGLHPGGGMTPRPFMRPAADAASGQAAILAAAGVINAV